MRIAFEVSTGSSAVMECRLWTTEAGQFSDDVTARIDGIVHVLLRIRRNLRKDVSVHVRPVTGFDETRDRSSIRQLQFGKCGRNLKLSGWAKVIPVRQRPLRGMRRERRGGRTNLSLQGDQIAAVPWRKIPSLVLTLIPIQSLDARRRQRRGWDGRRRRKMSPAGKLGQRYFLSVNRAEEPPTVLIIQLPRLHDADAFRVP